jgi:hypothetical protein
MAVFNSAFYKYPQVYEVGSNNSSAKVIKTDISLDTEIAMKETSSFT